MICNLLFSIHFSFPFSIIFADFEFCGIYSSWLFCCFWLDHIWKFEMFQIVFSNWMKKSEIWNVSIFSSALRALFQILFSSIFIKFLDGPYLKNLKCFKLSFFKLNEKVGNLKCFNFFLQRFARCFKFTIVTNCCDKINEMFQIYNCFKLFGQNRWKLMGG